MRKFLVPIIAAGTALAVAAPAAAQWAPPVYNYQPYDYGRGYNYHRFAGEMNHRVERIRADIRQLQARRIVSWQEARSLEYQAAQIQRRIYNRSRNGLQPMEARGLENQIRNLELRISREARDWNNRPNRAGYHHRY
jgi:predicted RNase H-like nuclease (RuvC/YqgF family)